jgi:hypothetical protein
MTSITARRCMQPRKQPSMIAIHFASFRGKSAAIDMTKRQKTLATTAYHEAGHAVIDWWHGFRVKKVSIVRAHHTLGRTTTLRPKYDFDNADYFLSAAKYRKLELWIIGLLSGIEAQRVFAPTSVRGHHSHYDDTYVADFLEQLNGFCQEEFDAHLKLLKIRARNLVKRLWPAIEVVANELLDRKEIDAEELHRLMCDSHRAAPSGDRSSTQQEESARSA